MLGSGSLSVIILSSLKNISFTSRRSGIPCNIVPGIGKDEQFFIGTSEKSMQTRWTAVFADDEWHLAHIEWAIKSSQDKDQNNVDIEVFYTDD